MYGVEKPKSVKDFAALGICVGFVLVGVWLFFRYALGIIFPFVLGWGLAVMVRPLAKRVGHGTRIPQRFLRLAFVTVAFVLLGLGVYFVGTRLTKELGHLIDFLGSGESVSFPPVIAEFLERLAQGGDGEIGNYLGQAVNSLVGALTNAVPSVLGKLVSSVPRVVLALAMVLISSIYFCLDLEEVHGSILKMFPEKVQEWLKKVKNGIFHVGGTYLRSYLILMGITFAILLVAFLLLRVDYALLLAFVISLVDLFPVLGVGTVLGPWAVWCFFTGAAGRGIALLVLWMVALFVRQFAEPRLLGGSLGVHPLLTLFAMYAGLLLCGVPGMLLFPALCVPLVSFIRRTRDRKKGGVNSAKR